MTDDLLTIGRFARLCRLSVKRLRHYDETGLLQPVRVDPTTGYRYYGAHQAADALTVALLRDMDVPLSAIAKILAASGDERDHLLRSERDRLAARIARDNARLRLLDRLSRDGKPGYDVKLGVEAPVRLAVVSATCLPEEIGDRTRECVRTLQMLLADSWVPFQPPLRGLFPLDLGEVTEVAIGAAVYRDVEGARMEELAGGPAAATVHAGPYAELSLAYHALLGWVYANGLRPVDRVREEYLVTPDEAAQEDLLTRLIVPIEGETP